MTTIDTSLYISLTEPSEAATLGECYSVAMGINGGDILGSTHLYKNISDPKQCQMRCQHNLECNYFVFDLIMNWSNFVRKALFKGAFEPLPANSGPFPKNQ